MINYIEKGEGLSHWLASQGIELAEVYTDGQAQLVSNVDDETVSAKIAEYNPWPFEKAKKLAELNTWFEEATAQLVAGSTQIERDSWTVQVNEAYGLRPVSMLAVMAQARGVSLEDLIAKVKYKADLYNQHYGALQGRRDAFEDQIKSFPDEGSHEQLTNLWSIRCMG